MRTVSWVLLAVVGVATLFFSLESALVAYRPASPRVGQERIGPATLAEVAATHEGVETALRARRGTAAAYAAGFGTLFLFVVLGPYRRGDVWSWWALLASTLVLAAVVLLRVPALGTRSGAGTALVQLGLVIVALLLDAGRLPARG